MERIVHQLVPNTPEWAAFRLSHHGASEAAAMLGLSKKTKRTELLRMKHTGLPKEFGEWLQTNVLDKGHEIEALARPFAVEFAGVDGFYPATVSVGRLSASCDGIDMLDETAWECKSLNQDNRPIVLAGRVPEEHMPQCQQVLMVTGADRLLFTVSDGTRENTFHTWVEPDTTWFDRIRAGWKQFDEDLANYVHIEDAPAAVAAPQPSLPAPVVRMDGALTVASNLPDFAVALRAYIANIPTSPSSDQEFADCEAACKSLKKAEDALQQAEDGALAQMTDVEQMRRVVGDLRTLARTTRLASEKMVAARKEQIRVEIYQTGIKAYQDHIAGLNARLGKAYMPTLPVDFAGAIKNKRTVDSLRDAVSIHLAAAKIAANEVADRIQINLDYLREHARDHAFLFADIASIVLKASDDLAALVQSRIMAHQKAEADRLERERAAIAEQERGKAEAKVRADIEAAAKAEREEAERQRRADQEARDAIAKAAVPVAQPAPEPAPAIVTQATALAAPVAMGVGVPFPPPSMALGHISTRLGFQVTGAFLRQLGFEPAMQVKAAMLYHESDFPAICQALIEHIESVMETAPA